ncbi:MAG: hypothetical protein IJL34_00265 [Treponema sp.]|nr:hypothetical protein [Treponema sp.]
MEKKTNIAIPLGITLSVLYIILAARPLSKEAHFISKWTVDANRISANADDAADKNKIPFRIGQTAGYFTEDGIISNVFTFPYKVSISPSAYAVYGSNGKPIKFNNPDGSQAGQIELEGFPFFQQDRKYLMLPGGNAFSALNNDGTVNWSFENYAPITAFSSSESGVIAGYADGTVITFDQSGTILDKYSPGGSRYQVILGAAISKDANYYATVSGQDEQRFVLVSRRNGTGTIIFHEFLKTSTNRQVPVVFSEDSNRCFFAYKDGLGVVDINKLKITHIKIKGAILSIQLSDDSDTVFILSKADGRYTVSVLEKYSVYTGSFSFKADHAFINVHSNRLFVGKDSSISCMEFQYK